MCNCEFEGETFHFLTSVGTPSKAPKKRIFIVFHFPCSDGFGSAWAYYRSILDNPPKEPTEIKFVGTSPRFDNIDKLYKEVTGEDTVYFFDCCPDREIVIAFYNKVKEFGVWDHHLTNEEKCKGLPYCHFDKTRSGAGLVWDTFNETKRPRLINAIEDQDLWRWKDRKEEFSPEIMIVMETIKFDFNEWDKYHFQIESDVEPIVEKGRHYIEYRKMVSRRLVGGKVHKITFKTPEGKITLPAVNASIMQNGVGASLVRRPGPAGAIYYTRGRGWIFSLRSSNDGPDVSKIAELYGGGGHRNAAAFKIDSLDSLEFSTYKEEETTSMEVMFDDIIGSFDENVYSPKTIKTY